MLARPSKFPDYLAQGETPEQVQENLRDLYKVPVSGVVEAMQPVPRHREVNEFLAKHTLETIAS